MTSTDSLLIAEVKRMRSLQKEYFKNRNQKVLQDSKSSEKLVDKILEGYTDQGKPKAEQATLF
jgi:hypothetical protein